MDQERWERIEMLYHAARERESGERAAFLTEACGDDEALRREIEAMLAGDERAGKIDKSAKSADDRGSRNSIDFSRSSGG